MGLFGFGKKKNNSDEPPDDSPNLIGNSDEPSGDPMQFDFERIINSINEYFIPEPIADEKELQGQLAVFFRTKYPDREVEREVSIGRGSRVDIVIDQRFAFELKVPRNRVTLRDLISQLDEYSETFPKLCAILLIFDHSLIPIAEEYSKKYKQQCNAETVIIDSGTKRNSRTQKRKKIDEPRPTSSSSPKYSRPNTKTKTKADKVAKGIKGVMKVLDSLNPDPVESKPTRKRKSKQRRKKDDEPWGLDKVGDFFGSDEPKRKKKDDDPFGMNSFDDFFGGSKKKKRKSDDDLWGL
ncbi:MAG: hypothetical protein HN756_02100 [Nitrosopumilus sp.]|jgi:hypothetical protein|nr:hypothetical protein [Nitrosopumilus sp.]